MSNDTFVMSVGQAAQLDRSFLKAGFTPADVHQLCNSEVAKKMLGHMHSDREIVMSNFLASIQSHTLPPQDHPFVLEHLEMVFVTDRVKALFEGIKPRSVGEVHIWSASLLGKYSEKAVYKSLKRKKYAPILPEELYFVLAQMIKKQSTEGIPSIADSVFFTEFPNEGREDSLFCIKVQCERSGRWSINGWWAGDETTYYAASPKRFFFKQKV